MKPEYLSALAAIFSAFAAFVIGILSYYHNKNLVNLQKRNERRKSIEKRLNEFYGPIVSYLDITRALHNILVKGKPDSFKTLTYLLDPTQTYEHNGTIVTVVLNESDKQILREIINIEEKIEELIIDKAGLMDDAEITLRKLPKFNISDNDPKDPSVLTKAVLHYRLLRYAFEGGFQKEVERFSEHTYSTDFDKTIIDRMNALRAELDALTKVC